LEEGFRNGVCDGESGLEIIGGMARGSVGSVSEPYF